MHAPQPAPAIGNSGPVIERSEPEGWHVKPKQHCPTRTKHVGVLSSGGLDDDRQRSREDLGGANTLDEGAGEHD